MPGSAAYFTIQSAQSSLMSQEVSWSLEEVRPKKALLGLLTFNFLYAGSHPDNMNRWAEHTLA